VGSLDETVNWASLHFPVTCLLISFQTLSSLLLIPVSSFSCFLGHSLCDQNMDKWERFQLTEKDKHLLQLMMAPEQKMQHRQLIRNQRSVLRETRNLPRHCILKECVLTIILADKNIFSMDMCSTAAFWYQWGLGWSGTS